MTIARFARLGGSTALAILVSAPIANADEGMWTFDNFPIAKVNAKYGTDINQAWLDHVRGAAVRLSSGCSASTVSGSGLVLTNNHCVVGCAQNLSSSDNDYYTNGYTANGLSEERKCAGMNAEILTSISDVTGKVTAAGAGETGSDLIKARNAVITQIEEAGCGDDEQLRCQVVNLYHGGQYKLYKYRRYSDVRLVFSPGITAAFFGGDPDNFNFPRYDLDSAFVRLYENGKPVATPDHLTWNPSPPKAGEPVFVAGNPGSTDRQLTVSQLETQRDLTLPITALMLSELRGRLIRFSDESAEHKRVAQDLLFGLQNSYKVYYGRLFALKNQNFMDAKRADQAALQAKVTKLGNKLPADFGTPWKTIDKVQGSIESMYLPYRFVSGGPIGSELFSYARELVRAAQERQKPSDERLPGYSDADLPRLQKSLFDDVPVHADLEEVLLDFWLSKAREYLTADSPETRLLLGKESPESLAEKLSQSKLGDPALRKQLYDGGMQAILASDDPMIQYALRIDPEARKLRSAWEEQVSGPLTTASEKIAKARFLALGDSIYPDATFTLRLSYGKIAGWTYRGTDVPPFTHFAGLYERATGYDPYKLDSRWVKAKDDLNLSTIFDISTTNDIIGGNSGSPLINAKGEVIGAVFDGNIHSLGGNYGYDPALNRTVAVSAAAVDEALRKVYHADAIADELDGKTKPS